MRTKRLLPITALLLSAFAAEVKAQQLRGSVSDPEGQAVRNADITVEVHDWRVRRKLEDVETQTDIAGMYYIDLSKFADRAQLGLRITAGGDYYVESTRIITASPKEIPKEVNFTLQHGFPIVGTVTDQSQVPMRGARVFVGGVAETTTDGEGRYRLRGIPSTGSGTVSVTLPGYAPQSSRYPMGLTEIIELNFVMQRAANFEGILVPPAGKAVGNGTIMLGTQGEYWRGRIHENGRFTFDTLPPRGKDFTLSVTMDNYPPVTMELEQLPFGETLRIPLELPAQFVGRVTSKRGNPIVGASVYILSQNMDTPLLAHTNSKGEYQFPVYSVDQSGVILVIPAEDRVRSAVADIQLRGPDSEGKVTGTIPQWPAGHRSAITGTLLNDTLNLERIDTGESGYSEKIVYTAKINPSTGVYEGEAVSSEGTVKGTFLLRRFESRPTLAGWWEIRETLENTDASIAPKSALIRSAPFATTHRVNITLDEGVTLTGRYRHSTESGIRPEQIVINEWHGSFLYSRTVTVERDGRFTIANLPTDTLAFHFLGAERNRVVNAPIYLIPTETPIELDENGISNLRYD